MRNLVPGDAVEEMHRPSRIEQQLQGWEGGQGGACRGRLKLCAPENNTDNYLKMKYLSAKVTSFFW